MVRNMSVSSLVYLLKPVELRELYNTILETGVMLELGKSPSRVFKAKKKESKGKLKKLYSILAKYSKEDYNLFYKFITEDLYE